MSSLTLRILSALVLAPPVLAASYFGAPYFDLLLALTAVVMAWEWQKLCEDRFGLAGIKIALFSLLALFLFWQGKDMLAIAAVGVAAFGVFISARATQSPKPQWMALGAVYVALPLLALMALRQGGGWESLLWVLLCVWASDTGAYFTGRSLGGPKLAPRISPNKTWSGAIGGVVASVLVGLGFVYSYEIEGLFLVLLASAALSVASQAGDLFESWVKRRFDKKDSSHIIPGHGGVFDRVDGLLTAAPLAAILIYVMQGGLPQW